MNITNTLQSNKIIDLIKKNDELQVFQDLFFIPIAQIQEVTSQSKNSTTLMDLNLILDVQLPKIIDSYLNLTEEQKHSDKKIRNGKTNKELFTEQIILINEKIQKVHEAFLEEKQHDFLVMHRKTKTISESNSSVEIEKEFEYKEMSESLKEKGITLFKMSDYSMTSSFNNEEIFHKEIDVENKNARKNALILGLWALTLGLFILGIWVAF